MKLIILAGAMFFSAPLFAQSVISVTKKSTTVIAVVPASSSTEDHNPLHSKDGIEVADFVAAGGTGLQMPTVTIGGTAGALWYYRKDGSYFHVLSITEDEAQNAKSQQDKQAIEEGRATAICKMTKNFANLVSYSSSYKWFGARMADLASIQFDNAGRVSKEADIYGNGSWGYSKYFTAITCARSE